MLKAFVIDDEKMAIQYACHLLEEVNVDVIGSFAEAIDAIDSEEILQPDIIFLDVNMPRMNGMRAVERLQGKYKNAHIVLLTAHDRYAVEAFELEIADYLLKPVEVDRLKRTVERIEKLKGKQVLDMDPRYGKPAVKCFGDFEIRCGSGSEVKWRTGKTKELIAYLVHHQSRYVSKDKILEDIWPEMDPEKSVQYLYNGIYYTRKALETAGIGRSAVQISSVNNQYRIIMNEVAVDVIEFEAAVKFDGGDCIAALEKIAELYKGHYLGQEDYL